MTNNQHFIAGVRAVGIYATDLEKSIRFYCDTLSFTLVTKIPPAIAILKSGSVSLYIESGYKPNTNQQENVRATVFLDVSVPATEMFTHLKSAGVKILQEKPERLGDDVWWFQFEDVDGNILEITSSSH